MPTVNAGALPRHAANWLYTLGGGAISPKRKKPNIHYEESSLELQFVTDILEYSNSLLLE